MSLYAGYSLNYGWKSGWVPAFAAVGATVFLVSWRMGVLCALLAIFPAARLVPELLSSDAYSISTRLDALLILAEIIRISPILGFGFGNYYWYTPLFRIRGWTVSFNSHNNYVDIAAQTGLLGLGFFLWFFGEAFYLGLRLRNAVPEGFARAYVYGSLGGLIGTLVAATLGDWVLPFVYNIGMGGFRTGVLVWLFIGGLVALEQMYMTRGSA
jgi:O-antigen ligase